MRRTRLAAGVAGLLTALLPLVLAVTGPAQGAFADTGQASVGVSTATLPSPAGLRCSGTTLASASVQWDPASTASGWRVVLPSGAVTDLPATTTSIATGLVTLPATWSVTLKHASGWTSSSSSITVLSVSGVCLFSTS